MKTWLRSRIVTAAVIALVALATVIAPLIPAVSAAPPRFPAIGSMVVPVTFHLTGAKTATQTNAINFVAPFSARLLYATLVSGAKSGAFKNSHGASGLQIKMNSNIATQGDKVGGKFVGLAVGVAAAGAATETNATAASGTPLAPTAQNVTSGQTISADLIMWGLSPSVTDTTVIIWLQRTS